MSFAEDKSVAVFPARVPGVVTQYLKVQCCDNIGCGKRAARVSAACRACHSDDMTTQPFCYCCQLSGGRCWSQINLFRQAIASALVLCRGFTICPLFSYPLANGGTFIPPAEQLYIILVPPSIPCYNSARDYRFPYPYLPATHNGEAPALSGTRPPFRPAL